VPATERTVQYYYSAPGIAPFREWRKSIADQRTKAAIDARIARLRGGNFGDSEPIGEGASESKIDFGAGYRIYYGTDGKKILLLHGGDKSSQPSDIKAAQAYWKDYKERRKQHAQKPKLQGRPARGPSK
jgi:putative addiction module killer protein